MIPLDNISHILVSRLRFMGDVILTTPLLHALRSCDSNLKITYLAESPYHSLLKYHPDVDDILFLKPNRKWDQVKILSTLFRNQFDVAIDLFGNPRSALYIFLSGAHYRIGGHFRGRHVLYTHQVKDDGKTKSAIAFHLQYLKPLGVTCCTSDPVIVVTKEEKKWARQYLEKQNMDLKKLIIGVHPGASWPAKRWLPERFALLANKLVSELNAQIFFTLGPGEDKIVKLITRHCNFITHRPDVLGLRQLAAVLSIFDLYISNDCGPMHLAPAVGTKTVGLFGPSEPEIWFPYSPEKGHRYVHHEMECSRCHKDFCDKIDCMKAIGVEEVFNAAVDALNLQ